MSALKCYSVRYCRSITYLSLQEYDNEAECVMSSLAINYDDEDIDIGRHRKNLYTNFNRAANL